MLINEISRHTGATKKAIEYYCAKGLLKPEVSDNGYRIFSEEDAERLKKIVLLRNLGLSIEEIRNLIDAGDSDAFEQLIEQRERNLARTEEQIALLKELADTQDYETVGKKEEAAKSRQSIADRLIHAFPGFYGNYLALHFAQFLKEPVKSAEQKAAYEEIIAYLDGLQFEVPEDLEAILEEMNTDEGKEVFSLSDQAVKEAINDPEQWMKDHKEMIEQYLAFTESDEYKNSPAARLKEMLKAFQLEKGYNTVFIPAMRRLSPSYDAYLSKLQEADRIFSEKYTQ